MTNMSSSFPLIHDDLATRDTSPPPYYPSSPAMEAHSNSNLFQEDKVCRICLSSNDDIGADRYAPRNVNPLIQPCLCKGSMAYVHIRCLQRWRAEQGKQAFQCEICHYSYNISRPFWAKIIGSPILAGFLTLVIIFGLLLAIAYIVKVIDVYGFHHIPIPEDPNWQEWHGNSQFIWLDRFYLLISLLIMGCLGFIAIGFMSCSSVVCGWDISPPSMNMAYCEMGACGECGVFIFVVIAVIGFFAACLGTFVLVYTLLSKSLTHAKERVLEVID
ncbi:hypothetical protein INT43_003450 [Umbelopsis isabellina]|uniref:RING-CH-type domain-containing protein n=1 Tax=Mortierella isabellina TaxID=91625 RepID=A0A8H7PQ29_MORIS|nr:hypothetical protein INT43_003450 [Umbelopsis isabellina]